MSAPAVLEYVRGHHDMGLDRSRNENSSLSSASRLRSQSASRIAVGLLAGFTFSTGAPEIAAGLALCLLIGYVFSWVFAFIGLLASSPEAANGYGFTIIFPITFISSAFVPLSAPRPRAIFPHARARTRTS